MMSLLQMSLQASFMIVMIVPVRAVFLHKFPKKAFPILWWTVLFRLLFPLSVESPLSIYGHFTASPLSALIKEESKEVPALAEREPIISMNETAPVFEAEEPITGSKEIPEVVSPPLSETFRLPLPSFQIIWSGGFFLIGLFFLIVYFRFMRRFRVSLPIDDPFIKHWQSAHPLRRKYLIRQSDEISSPLSYGLFHPVILLPKTLDRENRQVLHYILTHEYTHIRHFDIFTKAVMIFALCLHWFNPLVWVMYLLLNRDIELACDETVLRCSGMTHRSSYAYTLIDMEAGNLNMMPFCNHFNKNAIEERIVAIMKTKKISLFMLFLAVFTVCGVVSVFATSIKKERETSKLSSLSLTSSELSSLEKLKYPDYKDLTVSAFKEKVNADTDSEEMMKLLEKASNDPAFYERRHTDETSRFFHTLLMPLTAEGRIDRPISDHLISNDKESVLEYQFFIEVIKPEHLKVGDYEAAVQKIRTAMQDFLMNAESRHDNEKELQASLKEHTETLKKSLENEFMKIRIDGTFHSGFSEGSTETSETTEKEIRHYPYAKRKDYASLFQALKTKDYKKLPLKDFNLKLLNWGNNQDHSVYESINADIAGDDFRVNLSKEERDFLRTTVFLSGLENAEKIKALHTKRKEKAPLLEKQFASKYQNEKDPSESEEWFELFFRFHYKINDGNITVGERDRIVSNFLKAADLLWRNYDRKALKKLEEGELYDRFEALSKKHGEGKMKFILPPNLFFFRFGGTSIRFDKTPESVVTENIAADLPEYWTYREYQSWLEKEKKELRRLPDSGAKYKRNGRWIPWTKEDVEAVIRSYERELREIKNGALITKPLKKGKGIERDTTAQIEVQTEMISEENDTIIDGKNTNDASSTATESTNWGNGEDILKAYTSLGLKFVKETDVWEYEGHHVAGLTDKDLKTYLHFAEGIKDSVYLEVLRDKEGKLKTIKKLTKKAFEKKVNLNQR